MLFFLLLAPSETALDMNFTLHPCHHLFHVFLKVNIRMAVSYKIYVFDAQVDIHYMIIAYYSKRHNQRGTLQKRKRVIEVMKRLFSLGK